MGTMLEAALRYASMGWPVLPLHMPVKTGPDAVCSCGREDCGSVGKHPRLKHGLKDATADVKQVRVWWKRWPDANIGVVTGPASGLWVLDVDGSVGVANIKALNEHFGELPPAPVQQTGGGYHIIFAFPAGGDFHNKASFVPHLDVRADGGYIVVAPSLHRSGRRYKWVRDVNMDKPPLPPAWLLDLAEGRLDLTELSQRVDLLIDKPPAGDDGHGGSVPVGNIPRVGVQAAAKLQPIDPARVLHGVAEGQRDAMLFRYACRLRTQGVPRADAEALVLIAAGNCDPPFPEREAKAKVESAWRYKSDVDDGRPRLELVPHDDKATAVAAAAILRKLDKPIFLRGRSLVRLYQLPKDEVPHKAGTGYKILRPGGSVTLEPVESHWLASEVESVALVVRMDTRRGIFKPARFSQNMAFRMIAHRDICGWRPLDSIVRAPLLLPDGTWVGKRGYQSTPMGGFYVDIDPADGWKEPPTDKVAAGNALAEILAHYKYMAWADDLAKSAGLSALLTAIMRPVLPSAPLHAIDAPLAGTGKSLFARSISVIATGGEPPTYTWAKDKNENGKWIGAALRSGDQLVVIDNVDAPVDDADLAQILTAPHKAVRVLGESRVEKLPTRVTFLATGNNMVFRGDMTRRVITCRLDSKLEDPENRNVPQDLIAETFARRVKLVQAAQTIMRAWYVEGRPGTSEPPFDLPRLGSFAEWSDIRYALQWLGYPDPADTIRDTKDVDPSRVETTAIYEAWFSAYGTDPVSARELASTSDPGLRDALYVVAGKADKVDSRRLGYWLRSHKDTPVDGKVLRRFGNRQKGHLWAVVQE